MSKEKQDRMQELYSLERNLTEEEQKEWDLLWLEHFKEKAKK